MAQATAPILDFYPQSCNPALSCREQSAWKNGDQKHHPYGASVRDELITFGKPPIGCVASGWWSWFRCCCRRWNGMADASSVF